MTADFQRAAERVAHDVTLDDGAGADLVAVGVQRSDCLDLLATMYEEGDQHSPEWLAMVVQVSVAVGVWLERARWQSQAQP